VTHSGEESREYTARQIADAAAGIVLAPAAWAISFQTKYMLVPFACQGGNSWLLHLISPIALAFAAMGLLGALRTWRLGGRGWPGNEHDSAARNRFLGMFGIIFTSGMMLLIVTQWIPVFFLDPCAHG
jgi:hypothetical protein